MRGFTAADGPAAAVEVEVNLEPGRQVEVGCRRGLFQWIIRCVGVHLEHHVPLVPRTLHLLGEYLCRTRPRPRRHRHHVSNLLPQQLVNRHLKVLAHGVVQRRAETQVEVVHHEVERAAVDQVLVHRGRWGRPRPIVVTVPDDAHVGMHLEHDAAVDAAHPTSTRRIVVPLRQCRMNRYTLDIGDLHTSPRRAVISYGTSLPRPPYRENTGGPSEAGASHQLADLSLSHASEGHRCRECRPCRTTSHTGEGRYPEGRRCRAESVRCHVYPRNASLCR